MINIQKDVNETRTRSYLDQNIFEKSFDKLEFLIMGTKYVSSVSSKTKNIKKVGLDMLSHPRKSQITTIADNIRTGDISLSKDKNISKGIQEMSIFQKDESLKNNNPSKDKHLPSEDKSPPKDKLLLKGENSDEILFFPKEKT